MGGGLACDFVSTSLRHCPLPVFHRQILRSAVPPPLASTLCWNGHQARALTAAACRSMHSRGRPCRGSQMCSRLSLPPDASCVPCEEPAAGRRRTAAPPPPPAHRSRRRKLAPAARRFGNARAGDEAMERLGLKWRGKTRGGREHL